MKINFQIPDKIIDVSGDICPMTFVKTRLALDKLASGQILEVMLHGSEPRRSVPDTARRQGYLILDLQDLPNGNTRILIKKP